MGWRAEDLARESAVGVATIRRAETAGDEKWWRARRKAAQAPAKKSVQELACGNLGQVDEWKESPPDGTDGGDSVFGDMGCTRAQGFENPIADMAALGRQNAPSVPRRGHQSGYRRFGAAGSQKESELGARVRQVHAVAEEHGRLPRKCHQGWSSAERSDLASK